MRSGFQQRGNFISSIRPQFYTPHVEKPVQYYLTPRNPKVLLIQVVQRQQQRCLISQRVPEERGRPS